MRRIYKQVILLMFLFGQNLAHSSFNLCKDQEDYQQSLRKSEASLELLKTEPPKKSINIFLDERNKSHKDTYTLQMLINCTTSNFSWGHSYLGEDSYFTEIDLSNNQLTDSGAISLSCIIDYAPNLKKLNICGNSGIGKIGIDAIFTKIFTNNLSNFIFCFTAQQEIKSDIEELACKYKKNFRWNLEILKSKNVFDFEISIGHVIQTSHLKEKH